MFNNLRPSEVAQFIARWTLILVGGVVGLAFGVQFLIDHPQTTEMWAKTLLSIIIVVMVWCAIIPIKKKED